MTVAAAQGSGAHGEPVQLLNSIDLGKFGDLLVPLAPIEYDALPLMHTEAPSNAHNE